MLHNLLIFVAPFTVIFVAITFAFWAALKDGTV